LTIGYLGLGLARASHYEGVILIIVAKAILARADEYTKILSARHPNFTLDNSSNLMQMFLHDSNYLFDSATTTSRSSNIARENFTYSEFHDKIMSLLEVLLFWSDSHVFLGKEEKPRVFAFRKSIAHALVADEFLGKQNDSYLTVCFCINLHFFYSLYFCIA
jgi:hypothetical protein